MDDKGCEDAAILLMSIGEQEASEVFKHLSPKEVQKLGETIAKLKVVPRVRVEEVLDRFEKVAGTQSMLVADTDEYVRQVLRKALGDDKANLLLDRILQGSDVSSIESLKWMDPGSVAELLRNEHPQIVAAILAHLEFDQVADVLKLWSERHRNEGPQRGDEPDPGRRRPHEEEQPGWCEVGRRDHQHDGQFGRGLGARLHPRDGRRAGAEDHGQHVHLRRPLQGRRQGHPVPAQGGAERVAGAGPQGRQPGPARQGVPQHVRGPVRVSEVEAEQKEMLKIVRRLVDEGQIVLASGGDDQFL